MASAPHDVSYNAAAPAAPATPAARKPAGYSASTLALAVVFTFIIACAVAGISIGLSIHFSERAKDTKTTETKIVLR